jgi:16S rRNA (adenine1518-N6/adenine1519-N6)-dimethyltransferase
VTPPTRARARSRAADGPLVVQAKQRLRGLGARAAKGLGQHFLVDRGVLETIVGAAELGPEDVVVEVGPGLGALTEALLAEAGNVIAVEVDSRMAAGLETRSSASTHLTVLNADVLDLDPAELVSGALAPGGDSGGYKVVANLPYYLAAAILRHFLEASVKPVLMVVMVQKEVGRSIASLPGKMTLLGVSVQLYGRPTIVDYVPASAFYPKPKVDSAIVRIDVYARPAAEVDDVAGFFEVVRAGFRTPRKQMRNSLSLGLGIDPAEAEGLLRDAGIGPQLRPGALSIEEWARLHQVFAGRRKR